MLLVLVLLLLGVHHVLKTAVCCSALPVSLAGVGCSLLDVPLRWARLLLLLVQALLQVRR
jgi:hypothetical protein